MFITALRTLPRLTTVPRHIPRAFITRATHSNTFPQPTQAKDSFATETPVEEHIVNDHRSFEELYDRYKSYDGNVNEQQAIINEFVREVAQHSVAEELIVYPALETKNAFNAGHETADHLRHDHGRVKRLLYKLDSMRVGDDGFDTLLKETVDTLKEHAKEEETKELPELKKLFGKEERVTMSRQFLRRKAISPTRPHPDAPDKPPMETIAGLGVAPVDKLKDQNREFAQRRVSQ
ncbi:hypothetical protein HK104_001447 [Borealophlyctis nickersoniae]|nr:hypothetical protein HK104_001447 [Borealophlyctis nickersoniae]